MDAYRNQFRTDYRPILVTTKEQIDTMVKFMEKPRNFGLALNLITDVGQRQKLWLELVEILNNLGPPFRNLYRWRKVWNDLKSRSRNKYIAKNEYLLNPEGNRLPRLTILDERMIQVLGLDKQPNELILKYNQHKLEQSGDSNSNLKQNVVIKKENEETSVDNYDYQNYEPENEEQTISMEEALEILGSVEEEDCDNHDDNDADIDNIESFLNSPENSNVLHSIFNVQDEEINMDFNCNNYNRKENPLVIEDSDSDYHNETKKRRTENYRKEYSSNKSNQQIQLQEQPTFNLIISDAKSINLKSKSSTPIPSNKINNETKKLNSHASTNFKQSSMSSVPSITASNSQVNECKPQQSRSNINSSGSSKRCCHSHCHGSTNSSTNNEVQKKLLSTLNETNLTLKLFNKNLEELIILKKYDMNQRNEVALKKLELYNKELELKNKANDIELAKIVFNKKMKFLDN